MTTVELIRRGARRHRDRPAVFCGDEKFTFGQLDELASRMARVLLGRRSERVALLVGNGPYSLPLDFACAKA